MPQGEEEFREQASVLSGAAETAQSVLFDWGRC